MVQVKDIIKSDIFEKIVIRLNAPSLRHKTAFFRLLSVSQKAGLGIRDSLVSILTSEKNQGMKMIIKDLINQLTQGSSFANALSNHLYFFWSEEAELVRAAELTGNMPETLYEIANELENMQKINAKIRSALAYPTTLILFTIGAVSVLLIKVIPTIISLFPDKDKLPDITKIMISTSDFLIHYWFLILFVIAAVIFLYFVLYALFLPFKILVDKILIQIPVVADVTKTYYLYRFSKLMSDFYKAWVSPVVTLEQISKIFENYWYKKKIVEVKKDLEAGFGFSESMEWSDLFDPLLVQIILVWENTGNIWEIMGRMASFYRDLLRSRIATLMWFIEPLLMGMIAIVIGWVVGSIFLPMADLVNVLGTW